MPQKKVKPIRQIPALGIVRVDEESGFQVVKGNVPVYDEKDKPPVGLDPKDIDEFVKTSLGTGSAGGRKTQVGYSESYSEGWDRIFGKKKRPKQG